MFLDLFFISMLFSLFFYKLYEIAHFKEKNIEFEIKGLVGGQNRYLRLNEYLYGFRQYLGIVEIESTEFIDIRYMLQLLYPKARSGLFFYISAQSLSLDQSLKKEIYSLNWDFFELYCDSIEEAFEQLKFLLNLNLGLEEQTLMVDWPALLFHQESKGLLLDQGIKSRLIYQKRKLLSRLKPLLKKNIQVILIDLYQHQRTDKHLLYPIISRISLKQDQQQIQCQIQSHFHPVYQRLKLY